MKKIVFLVLLSFFIIGCYSNKITSTQVVTLAKTTKSWNGAKLPEYSEGEAEVTVLKISIPPKTKLAWHKHPEINAGVLLKGELTVINEAKDTLILKAGDPIIELVNTWHYGVNNGNKTVEIIVFYAGIKGKPITILKDNEHKH